MHNVTWDLCGAGGPAGERWYAGIDRGGLEGRSRREGSQRGEVSETGEDSAGGG